MSEQTEQRPTNDDKVAWKAFWKVRNRPWRTEPEIDLERQSYLSERRSITPVIEQGIYPFKNIKLSRADVEWLLSTHEIGLGHVDWSDESQRERKGLDLRGADLCQIDLGFLPLARVQGNIAGKEWFDATEEQRIIAGVRMQGARLSFAQLQGADLRWAQLQKADLFEAQLQGADLFEAQLQEANLQQAQLQKVNLQQAQLQKVNLIGAELQEANLQQTQLQEAYFFKAQLQKANLSGAGLQKADFTEAELPGADLREAQLNGINLSEAILSDKEYLSVLLADVTWGETNLAWVDWTPIKMLGDEQLAHQTNAIKEYRSAVRANRQLAVALRDQGLNEEADHFAYRAQLLQRKVWRLQKRPLKFLLSWFLYLLAGYGYRPLRSIIIYLLVI